MAIIVNGKTNDNEMYLLHKYIVLIVYYMETCYWKVFIERHWHFALKLTKRITSSSWTRGQGWDENMAYIEFRRKVIRKTKYRQMTWKGYENAQAARMQIVKLCGCRINPLLRTRISLPVRPPVQMRWSRSARTGCLCVRGLVHPPSVFWDALTGAMNTVGMNEPLAIAPFSALAVARLSACLSRFSSSPLPLPLLTLNMMWKDDFKSLPSSDRSEVCWWDIKTNTGEKKG